jgi:hypothetical protein
MDRTCHIRRAAARYAAALAAMLLLSSCIGGGPSPSTGPTAQPTPATTPDPHLVDPATVDDIYRKLRQAGVQVIGTNAQQGVDPVARINGSFDNWPLSLAQYTSTTARAKLVPYRDGAAPSLEEAPYTFGGLNIAVMFGPLVPSAKPAAVPPDKVASATRLAAELDRLIGPLVERSPGRVSPVAVAASPAPSP